MTENDEATGLVAERIAALAGKWAADAALRYFVAKGFDPTDGAIRPDEFGDAVSKEVSVSMDAGLADLREACLIGMPKVGAESFAASMRLAGIRAAKRMMGEL